MTSRDTQRDIQHLLRHLTTVTWNPHMSERQETHCLPTEEPVIPLLKKKHVPSALWRTISELIDTETTNESTIQLKVYRLNTPDLFEPLYWLPVCLKADLKILLISFKDLNHALLTFQSHIISNAAWDPWGGRPARGNETWQSLKCFL